MIETLIFLLGLLAFGTYKKDFASLIFAGIGFMAYGLILYPQDIATGAISIGFGGYVAIRSAIDLITLRRVAND